MPAYRVKRQVQGGDWRVLTVSKTTRERMVFAEDAWAAEQQAKALDPSHPVRVERVPFYGASELEAK